MNDIQRRERLRLQHIRTNTHYSLPLTNDDNHDCFTRLFGGMTCDTMYLVRALVSLYFHGYDDTQVR